MKKSLKKEFAFILTVTLVITGVFLFVHPSLAFADWAARVLSGLIGAFISGLGVVVGLVIEVLIRVAQYNDFTGSQAIEKGWIIVRDLANMFFILVFLIIAFATILRIESYNYKKHLPKLLLMAVFINFSKTIAGLIIDVGQVAMITFVNGFKDIGAGNLTHMLGLTEILQMKEGADVGDWTIFTAYLLAFFYILIALVTIVAILAVLVMRMVMLWIYVVLSPLAFLLAAFPGGKKYSEMWWSNFSKEVIVGPVLAFFIWLSFATVSITTGGNDIVPMSDITDDMTKEQIAEIQASNEQISQAATTDVFIKFIISIGMLVGGLVVSKQIGATAGKAAGSALNTINKGKDKVLGAGRSAIRGGFRRAGRQAKTWGGDALDAVNMNPADTYKRYKSKLQERRQKKKAENYQKNINRASKGGFRGAASMIMTGDVAFDEFKNHNLTKGMMNQKKIYKGPEKLNKQNKKIAELKGDEKDYMTDTDANKIKTERKNLKDKNKDIDKAIKKKRMQQLTPQTESDKLRTSKEIQSLKSEKKTNKDRIKDIDEDINNDPLQKAIQEKEQIEENIKKTKAKHGSGFGLTAARISAGTELEGEASKKIANVQNSGDLVEVIKEAIDRKDHAMIQAAYKKLAKTGNFNELNKDLGLGTGHGSMKRLAKEQFQGKAGMSEQASLGLIGEAGDLMKGVGQFSGFGHATMENGRWRETSEEEQAAAAFTESSKVQPQKWARDITHLGLGSYADDKPHTMENFTLSKDAVALMASRDEQTATQIKGTGNTNLINTLTANNNIKVLEQNGAKKTADELRRILSEREGASEKDDVVEMLKEIDLESSKKT